jgi:predicted metal-dependent HD superfamily phosphohydrolase
MPATPDALLDRSWSQLSLAWAEASPGFQWPTGLQAELQARYAEPQRHYHALQHLGECLQAFEGAQHLAERPAEVATALWFHDAIYALRASDNEARSADWAQQALRAAGAAAEAADRVHALVMATCHTAQPATPDAALLVDIDLAILGASPARFAEYEAQIRQEYSFVPGWLFRRKRRQILQGFLDRPRLYSTTHFHDALEAAARRNLQQVLG